MHADIRAALADTSTGPLRFVRHRRSGKVHVVVPRAAVAAGGLSSRTLCGLSVVAWLVLDHSGLRYDFVTEFDDVWLCTRCHRSLGPELQWRAFEHPRPRPASPAS